MYGYIRTCFRLKKRRTLELWVLNRKDSTRKHRVTGLGGVAQIPTVSICRAVDRKSSATTV